MGWLTWCISLLLGLSAGFSNVGIGVAYSVKNIRVPWVFFSIITFISVFSFSFGGMTGVRIGQDMSSAISAIIGTAVLICIGGWTILQTLFTGRDELLFDPVNSVGFSERMFITLAQGMANLSMGFGAGFLRLNILATSICVGTTGVVLLLLPVYLTKHFMVKRFIEGLPVISGLLLMCVGWFR